VLQAVKMSDFPHWVGKKKGKGKEKRKKNKKRKKKYE
jgi:hypothetical protein